jgi:hypothetical protein
MTCSFYVLFACLYTPVCTEMCGTNDGQGRNAVNSGTFGGRVAMK